MSRLDDEMVRGQERQFRTEGDAMAKGRDGTKLRVKSRVKRKVTKRKARAPKPKNAEKLPLAPPAKAAEPDEAATSHRPSNPDTGDEEEGEIQGNGPDPDDDVDPDAPDDEDQD